MVKEKILCKQCRTCGTLNSNRTKKCKVCEGRDFMNMSKRTLKINKLKWNVKRKVRSKKTMNSILGGRK